MRRSFALVTMCVVAGAVAPAGARAQQAAAGPPPATAQQDTTSPEGQARIAADAWLRLLDAGDFKATFRTAAPMFQKATSGGAWEQQAGQVRGQVGALESRQEVGAQYTTRLPNAPEGEYVLVNYASSFKNLPKAREVVIIAKTDGAWKVAGYFVRPAAD